MPIDLSAVGKKLGSVTHSYTERDVMLYALGVGCGTDDLAFTYERDLKVLPTFAVIPSFPAMLNLGGAMQVNPAMVLHGEQAIEVPAPTPPRARDHHAQHQGRLRQGQGRGGRVSDRIGRREGQGALPRHVVHLRARRGRLRRRSRTERREEQPARPAPDKSVSYKTLPQQALIYRLSGDMNPLHADPDFAAMGGFDKPILHGLCTYGHAGRAVLAAYSDTAPARPTSFEVRFSGVVFPGAPLTTDMWQVEPGKIAPTAKTRRRGGPSPPRPPTSWPEAHP
jgi:acyl dehydratase